MSDYWMMVNKELELTWKNTFLAKFKVCSKIFLEGRRKTTRKNTFLAKFEVCSKLSCRGEEKPRGRIHSWLNLRSSPKLSF
jgi:hypothetical protein